MVWMVRNDGYNVMTDDDGDPQKSDLTGTVEYSLDRQHHDQEQLVDDMANGAAHLNGFRGIRQPSD